MEKKDMRKIEEQLCDVLHDFADKGIRSANDVETTKHALSGLVKLKCLEEMEIYGAERSGRSYRSYEGEGGSMDGGSYRRDSRGRYRDGGYSGHGDVQQKLQELLRDADERDRDAIRQMVNRM